MKTAILAAAFAFAAAPAAAVSIVDNQEGAPDPGVPSGFTTVITFDDPTPIAAGIVNTTSANVYTGPASLSGQYAAPAGTDTNYQAVRTNGFSLFDFTSYLEGVGTNGLLSGFSLYWGSIDDYNTLEFGTITGSGFTAVESFTGLDVATPANGNQTVPETNRRITFGFDRADGINAVRFLSSQNAFEFDTIGITTSVPEPASWAMLIAGFGLVGATMRRRRQQPATVLA